MTDLDAFLAEKVGQMSAKVGKGHAMKMKWISRDKATGMVFANVIFLEFLFHLFLWIITFKLIMFIVIFFI